MAPGITRTACVLSAYVLLSSPRQLCRNFVALLLVLLLLAQVSDRATALQALLMQLAQLVLALLQRLQNLPVVLGEA